MIQKYIKGANEVIVKSEDGKVLLTQSEIDCKCDRATCTHTLFTADNYDSFKMTRLDYGSPIYITSGYRCNQHNKAIGGVPRSNHALGDGLDLVPSDGDLDFLEDVARDHYEFVLRYETFIHCDNRLNMKIHHV
jgi:hypothetical protein